jgi:hypothetical protein
MSESSFGGMATERRPQWCALLRGADEWAQSMAAGLVVAGTRGPAAMEPRLSGKGGGKNSGRPQRAAFRSCRAVAGVLVKRRIREEIIRRRIATSSIGFGLAGAERAGVRRAFPQLHEQAGQHRGVVLSEPLIEQPANLLAEIGGMTEAREFVTLQGVARSGKQKIPRGLGKTLGHGYLFCGDRNQRLTHSYKTTEEIRGKLPGLKNKQGDRQRDAASNPRQGCGRSLDRASSVQRLCGRLRGSRSYGVAS